MVPEEVKEIWVGLDPNALVYQDRAFGLLVLVDIPQPSSKDPIQAAKVRREGEQWVMCVNPLIIPNQLDILLKMREGRHQKAHDLMSRSSGGVSG